MKIHPFGLLPLLLPAAVLLSGLSVSARAQAAFAEALDAPGLQWSHSGSGRWIVKTGSVAHDGTDCVEVESMRTENGDYVSAMLTTEVTGPAVVRFWWQYDSSDTDPGLGFAVDGSLLTAPAWSLGMDGWSQIEIQLSPGLHTLGFRPVSGTIARLDQFSVTPGAGHFVQSTGNSPACWLVSDAALWSASADAPQGWSGSIAWSGEGDFAWAACLLPPNSKVEGWVKDTHNGCSISSSFFGDPTLYRAAGPGWRRVRTLSRTGWVTFITNYSEGNSPDLKIAGITVAPAGAGDVLDAPELTWTPIGSPPFDWQSYDLAGYGTGSFYVYSEEAPFDPGVRTSLTGPGRLFFNVSGGSGAGTGWRVRAHETVNGSFDGFWQRRSIDIPAGLVTAEISTLSEGGYAYAYLDDVTWCVAATAEQKDALDLPGSAEVWVRQSAAGLWTRTTADARENGGDVLSLAPSASARRADITLPAAGGLLAGMWIKAPPQTDLIVSRVGPAPSLYAAGERFQPPATAAGDWAWVPFLTGPDVAEMRFTVSPDLDEGKEIHFDTFRSYGTPVSVAEALDTTGITWSGSGGLAMPGSNAIGEDALVLMMGANPSLNTVSMIPGGPFRLKYRCRFLDPGSYGQTLFRLMSGPVTLREIPSPPDSQLDPSGWRDEEIVCVNVPANAALTIRVSWGILLLDSVEFHPLTEVTFAEALDAPAIMPFSPAGWKGYSGIGHDGTDALISPARSYIHGASNSWDMLIVSPFSGSAGDGGFWWKNDQGAELIFQLTENNIPGGAGRWQYAGTGWQQIRFHCDRMRPQFGWTQRLPLSASDLAGGEAIIDKLSLTAAASPDTFSRALDTDLNPPGSMLAPAGWNAIGSAAVSVQTAVTWRDGDALEVRPAPGGPPLQFSRISTGFAEGTDFSCRVKRGSNANCSLTIVVGYESYVAVPLTTEWTECRVLLPMRYASLGTWLTFVATVPDAGPDAVIYLDAVSLVPATDLNNALETTGLAWTSTGDGEAVIGGEIVPDAGLTPAYSGVCDGVNFQGLTHGQRRRVDTVITGPGTVVFTGYRTLTDRGDWRAGLMVDGVVRDSLPGVNAGAFFLQAVIPAGAHMVRWFIERDVGASTDPGALQLHSVAVVPGMPAGLLPDALESIAPGRTWVTGGSHPPVPLYSLKEGVTAVHGLFFPVSAFGETSWLETSLAGPATVGFTWQSAAIAACFLDGVTASRTTMEPGDSFVRDPRTVMHVPAGAHTLRWASAQGIPAKLRAFSGVSGSEIADVLAGSSPPVVWLHQPFYPVFGSWQVRTDETLLATNEEGTFLEVPGTGLPVLAGSDSTSGSFWVKGPAVVSYDVRRLYYSSLAVDIDNGSARHPHGPVDLQWHPDAVVVPAGDHLVSFWLPGDEGGPVPYTWLRNIRIQPGLPWITWAFGIGLVDISDSSPFDDPDADGIINLMEFAFGTQPRSFSAPAGPQLTGTPDQPRLQLPSLPWDAAGLTYDVEMSADLETWTSFTTVSPNPAHQPGPSVALPTPQEGRKFYRITVRF